MKNKLLVFTFVLKMRAFCFKKSQLHFTLFKWRIYWFPLAAVLWPDYVYRYLSLSFLYRDLKTQLKKSCAGRNMELAIVNLLFNGASSGFAVNHWPKTFLHSCSLSFLKRRRKNQDIYLYGEQMIKISTSTVKKWSITFRKDINLTNDGMSHFKVPRATPNVRSFLNWY